MADILHDFWIKAPPERVFAGVSTPSGLDQWWTRSSSGKPALGAEYQLGFGPEHDWRARVSRCEPGKSFELEMTQSDKDWRGTKVGFELAPAADGTQIRFHHTGWPELNEHHRISCYCWAMYLRVLKRHLEHGESVPYDQRLEV